MSYTYNQPWKIRLRKPKKRMKKYNNSRRKVVRRNFQDLGSTSKGGYGMKIEYAYQRIRQSEG